MENTQVIKIQSEQAPVLRGNITQLMAQANALTVGNDSELAQATEFTKQVKQLKKAIEDDKEAIFRPAKTVVDEITRRYKPMLDEVGKVEDVAKAKILTYQKEQLRIQREREETERKAREEAALAEAQRLEEQRKAEEEAIRQAAAEKQAQLEAEGRQDEAAALAEQTELQVQENAQAHEAVFDGMVKESAKGQEVKQTFNTGNASSTISMVWDFEVQDVSKLPPEFLLPNTAAIRQAVRDGNRTIAGVRIFQKETLSIR